MIPFIPKQRPITKHVEYIPHVLSWVARRNLPLREYYIFVSASILTFLKSRQMSSSKRNCFDHFKQVAVKTFTLVIIVDLV